MFSIWDHCHVDPTVVEEFEFLQNELNGSTARDNNQDTITNSIDIPSSSSFNEKFSVDNKIQSILCDTNDSCQAALELLDSVLLIVQDVKSAYFDVTGRTNSLIQKCEDLLEQQVIYTFQIISIVLHPFASSSILYKIP